jgi:hypothetical protein
VVCVSRASAVVAHWKQTLGKVSGRAAEAIADPVAYPNLFDGFDVVRGNENKKKKEKK